ncbi:MAG: hypothetical protein ACYTHM_05830 [Planctomycetota bacterium]
MKRHWLLFLPLVALLSACPLAIHEEVYPPVASDRPLVEADRPVPFERFLILMDGAQRQAFFSLHTLEAKERFLKEHGLTVKRMLADNLRTGMTTEQVERTLGRPQKEEREEHSTVPTERYRRAVDEWWVYQHPKTGNLIFIPFRRGWVVDWLLDAEFRDLILKRPKNDTERKKKEQALIHVQEPMPNLVRRPGEEIEEYRARMRRVAPILFSKGPPKWPEPLPKRNEISDFGKEKVSKQEVYSWWGDTSKLFETPTRQKPRFYHSSHTRWTYKIFNGYGFVYYSLYFNDNRLADWEVETGLVK